MVWRVCRDVLREANDADDAFQATFLLLARRAGAIRKRSSLAPWLHGVALRVARCARVRAARRRNREQDAAVQERQDSPSDVDRLDAARILHEEVGRLPEKYRSPLVLCYFEHLTHDQAASQLGWPVGTVRSRLAEARNRLRPRLLRRGVAPSVAILAATSHAKAAATLPAALISATVAMALRAGATGTVPAAAAALLGSTLRTMTLMKLSMIATGIVAAALLGSAGVKLVTARPQNPTEPGTPGPNPPAAQPKTDPQDSPPPSIYLGRELPSPPVANLRGEGNAPRILWARLNSAAANLQILKNLHESGQIASDRVIAAQGEVDALTAELNTRAEDFGDEVDLLLARLQIRKAELSTAKVQLAKATDALKFKQGLTEGLAEENMDNSNEVRLAQQDVDIRTGEVAKAQAEFDEVALRIKQATRRRDEATRLAERAKTIVPEQATLPKPAAAPAKP